MDAADTMPAMLRLQPCSAAAACIISHLSKHDKQQFSLSCKHARLLAVAAVMQLNLGHKWYSATCSPKPGNNSSSGGSAASSASGSSSCSGSGIVRSSSTGYNSSTSFPHCTCVAVRPRTMDELSNMTSALLLHKVKQLPALADLRLDLQVMQLAGQLHLLHCSDYDVLLHLSAHQLQQQQGSCLLLPMLLPTQHPTCSQVANITACYCKSKFLWAVAQYLVCTTISTAEPHSWML